MSQPSNPETGPTNAAMNATANTNTLNTSYLNSIASNPFAGGGTYNPATGAMGGGNGGNPTSPEFNAAASSALNFANTGDINPSSFDPSNADFESLAGPTGGVDPSLLEASGGYGAFKEAAESPTGLVTPAMASNVQEVLGSNVASEFSGLEDQLEAENAAGGNEAPGVYAGGVRTATEDEANNERNALLTGEEGLNQEEISSREWGASGASSAADTMAGIETGARETGAKGLAQNEANLNTETQQGQEFGTSTLSNQAAQIISSILGIPVSNAAEMSSYLNLLTQQNPTQKPLWQQILGGVGSIVPALGSLMGGGGGEGGTGGSGDNGGGDYYY